MYARYEVLILQVQFPAENKWSVIIVTLLGFVYGETGIAKDLFGRLDWMHGRRRIPGKYPWVWSLLRV